MAPVQTLYRKNRVGDLELVRKRISTISGQKTITPRILIDPVDQNPKLFFVFQDISIRMQGRFRILCQVINLET
jgi:hypothetical protein